MKFQCPNCNHIFENDTVSIGTKVLCCNCDTKFFIDEEIEEVEDECEVTLVESVQEINKEKGGLGKVLVRTFVVCSLIGVGFILFKYNFNQKVLREVPVAMEIPVVSNSQQAPVADAHGGGGYHLNRVLEVGDSQPKMDSFGRAMWSLPGAVPVVKGFKLNDKQIFMVCQPGGKPTHYHGLFGVTRRNWDNFTSMQFKGNRLIIKGENAKGGGFSRSIEEHKSVQPNQLMMMSFKPSGGNCSLKINEASPVTISGDVNANWWGAGYATASHFNGKVGELRIYNPLSDAMTKHVMTEMKEYWGFSNKNGFQRKYRQYPCSLDSVVKQVTSGELTLCVDNTSVNSEQFQLFVGRNEMAGSSSIDDLPADGDLTIRSDASWYLSANGITSENIYFSFSNDLISKLSLNLGDHGFYALLYRSSEDEDFCEVAVSQAEKSGLVVFKRSNPASGFYTLGMVQGIETKKSPLKVLFNGNSAETSKEFNPGELVVITCSDKDDFEVVVRERKSGVVWYEGSSKQMKLKLWIIHGNDKELSISIKEKAGYLAKKMDFTLAVNDDDYVFYPGIEAKVITLQEHSSHKLGEWQSSSLANGEKYIVWDVTDYIKKAGEYNINFKYTKGRDAFKISSASFLVKNVEICKDSHEGFAGGKPKNINYSLNIKKVNGQKIYLKAMINGDGGTDTAGDVFINSTTYPFPKKSEFKPSYDVVGAVSATDSIYKDYPTYRTAESVLNVKDRQSGHSFHKPDYWHLVCTHPSMSRKDENIIKWGIATDYPFGDLSGGSHSAVLMESFLLIEEPGLYKFEVQANVVTKLEIGNKDLLLDINYASSANKGWPLSSASFELELKPGLVPFSMIVSRHCNTPADLHMLWQKPNETTMTTLDGSYFIHKVEAKMEKAYKKFSNSYPWRTIAPLNPHKDVADAHAFIENPDYAKHVINHATFATMSSKLMNAWKYDKKYAGSNKAAEALLQLTIERTDFLRKNRSQLIPGKWSVCVGSYLKHYEWLRGFLEAYIQHPELQRKALETKTAILSYTARVYSRSFFGEGHAGTNDGYNDQHNFIINIWRAARVFDDPIAYDASRSLYDNHFSYGWGKKGCMHSDDIFCFHSANGRHLNMGGYGHNWLTRVLNSLNFGTPWGNTPEQYRRMAEFSLSWEWFFYKGAKAFTTAGRHNSHTGEASKQFADRLLLLPKNAYDLEVRKELEKQQSRIQNKDLIEGNHFFFRHLQMIHRRQDYYLDIKMASTLVGGIETFAGWQSGNLSFGDGVTTILRKGDEYRSIHAYNIPESLWRYRSLPGTTQLDYEYGNDGNYSGLDRYRGWANTDAGGVSNGKYGHCGFDFKSHGNNATRAKKFFAFLEDGMVVLGSAIDGGKDAMNYPLYSYRSNINQCSFRSDITVISEKGKKVTVKVGELEVVKRFPLNQRYWVEHDGIGYLVLPTNAEHGAGKLGELIIHTTMRNPINRMKKDIWKNKKMKGYLDKCKALVEKDKPRQTPVLTIWIDHGKRPKSAKCAYFICMRPQKKEAVEWMKNPPFEIITQSSTKFVIMDRDNSIVHAYLREAGDVKLKLGEPLLSVDKPASIMVQMKAGEKPQIIVQDIKAASTWNINEMSDAINITLYTKNGVKKTSFNMPGAGDTDDRYRGGMVKKSIK